MKCDDIEWLVDLLGTIDLLAYVISTKTEQFPVENVSKRGPVKSAFKDGKCKTGLYFCDGHWYSVNAKGKTDSYTKDYQKDGTAHFCQTFATMIFKGDEADLKPGQYANNIRAAMAFWTKLFKNDVEIANYFIKEIQTSEHADKNANLKKIDTKQVLQFLQEVSNNAQSLVGCIEG